MQRLNWSHEYNFDKGLERKGNLSVLQQKIISIKSFKPLIRNQKYTPKFRSNIREIPKDICKRIA